MGWQQLRLHWERYIVEITELYTGIAKPRNSETELQNTMYDRVSGKRTPTDLDLKNTDLEKKASFAIIITF